MKRIKELLQETIVNRLVKVNADGDVDVHIFKEAMDAYDRYLELLKIENAALKSEQELEVRRIEAENALYEAEKEFELKKKDGRRDAIIKGIEIVGIVIVTPMIGYATKKAFAQMLCLFEKDYTFTTIPGRSLSGLFKFKD